MQVKRSFSFKLVNRHADEGSGQLMGKEFFYYCLLFHRCIIAREINESTTEHRRRYRYFQAKCIWPFYCMAFKTRLHGPATLQFDSLFSVALEINDEEGLLVWALATKMDISFHFSFHFQFFKHSGPISQEWQLFRGPWQNLFTIVLK